MSRHFAAFAREHDFAVEWGLERHDVDPNKKHLCAACGTMRVTGTMFRVFDTRSRQWFEVAQNCFFRLKKRDMGKAAQKEADLTYMG